MRFTSRRHCSADTKTMAAALAAATVLGIVAPLAGQELAATPLAESPLAEIRLEDGDVAAWRKHLQPTGRELRWQEVPWLPTFAEGMLEADRKGKPLLLWTMNGHPLACT